VVEPFRFTAISTLSFGGQAEVEPFPFVSKLTGVVARRTQGIRWMWARTAGATQLIMAGGDFNPHDTNSTEHHKNARGFSILDMDSL
jgi:hypothetical protein